eukprot:GHRR01017975.1.p1 GENE.GHRR01017975.1~~GHRR01017975.1.p1  ORF type:complete len:523 (+),score=135.69 GHRR01017975.1:795-2363(+)
MAELGLNTSLPINETEPEQSYLYITDNRVTDSQLTTSLWLNALLGSLCLIAFCILQRSVFPKHYRYRQVSDSVTVKPRFLPTKGWSSLWAWLPNALFTPNQEIMRSAGMDAIVMIKALETGMQLFAPPALIGCAVLLPIHYTQKSFENRDISRSQLMQLTIAALPRGSNLMWVHFVLIVMYNVYAMFVLYHQYMNYVLARQFYLFRGDNPNYWMALTQQAEAEHVAKRVRKMLETINKETAKEDKRGGDDGDSEPPPFAAQATSLTSPEPPPLAPESSKSVLIRGFKKTTALLSTSVRSLVNPLHRASIESYKPYTNDCAPTTSPPATSPSLSMTGVLPGWGAAMAGVQTGAATAGVAAGGGGGNHHYGAAEWSGPSLDVVDSGSTTHSHDMAQLTGTIQVQPPGSRGGNGVRPAAAAPGAYGPSSTSDECIAAATTGPTTGTISGGSSRRWSSSSGGSDGSNGVRGLEGITAEFGRRSRVHGRPAKAATGQQGSGGGMVPTQQTINELHSLTAQQVGPRPC